MERGRVRREVTLLGLRAIGLTARNARNAQKFFANGQHVVAGRAPTPRRRNRSWWPLIFSACRIRDGGLRAPGSADLGHGRPHMLTNEFLRHLVLFLNRLATIFLYLSEYLVALLSTGESVDSHFCLSWQSCS